MTTSPLPSGPAGIPGLRRTSVLHPAVGGLGVFLGGSGKLRDGLQLQLLLPTRVSSPGLGPGGLRLGWGQRDFLDSLECPSPSVVPSPPPRPWSQG